MPLTPSASPQIQPLPMFALGQPSAATLYNTIAQKALDSAEAIRLRRVALEAQVTSLESRIATVSPQFATLLANANTLNAQVNSAIAANATSDAALTSIQSNITTNNQNADIQTARMAPLTALINSLIIGTNIQGYSDLLQKVSAATRLASRILGTDASGNILWRTAGSVGSGVLLKTAIFSRRLTDVAAGGAAPSLQAWNAIDLSVGLNTLGATYNTSTKQIAVPSGEYMFFGFTTGCSNGFQCRLLNVSNSSVIAIGTPAKSTTTTAIAASTEPVNFLSKLQGAASTGNHSLQFQSWFDTAANVAGNTQGGSAGITGYPSQQSALALIRVVY